MSGRAGWVVHGRESAFPVCPPQVGQVLAGEHGRQLGDASTVDADLAVPDLPGQNNTPTARCVAAFSVLDAPAAHAPQVPVVEDRAVGNQQLEHGVVKLDVHGDLTGWDVRGAQVQNGVPAVGPHLELAGGGPVAQALGHLVVRGDPDRCGWGGRCGVHRSVPLWNRATTNLVVSYDYPYSTIQCQLFEAIKVELSDGIRHAFGPLTIKLRRAYVTRCELDLATAASSEALLCFARRASVLGLDRALIRSEYR